MVWFKKKCLTHKIFAQFDLSSQIGRFESPVSMWGNTVICLSQKVCPSGHRGAPWKWHRRIVTLPIIELSCLWELGTCMTSVVLRGQFPTSLCILMPLSYRRVPARRKGTNWRHGVSTPSGRKQFDGVLHLCPSTGMLSAASWAQGIKVVVEKYRNSKKQISHWQHYYESDKGRIWGKNDHSLEAILRYSAPCITITPYYSIMMSLWLLNLAYNTSAFISCLLVARKLILMGNTGH